MSLTLARLLADAESFEMRQLAGRGGMNALVRWIHMVEDTEVPGFLHGNELVFTTGIAQKGSAWLTGFARDLREHGAVGLVVNLGPYIGEVPDETVRFCDAADFPLFTIPWRQRLTDVSYTLCRRIIASEENESGIAAAFRSLLTNGLLHESEARLLSRRGFYNALDYAVLLVSAERGGLSISGEEWDALKPAFWETLSKALGKPVFCFTLDSRFAVVSAGASAQELSAGVSLLAAEIFPRRPDTRFFAGVSDAAPGFSALSGCFRQAEAALGTAERTEQGCLCYGSLGLEKLLYAVNERGVLTRFADDALGEILRWDRMNGTDYADTLRAWLDANGSVQKVADAAGTHRNTVNNKMKTIREQFGLTLDYDDITKLKIAFAVRDFCRRA